MWHSSALPFVICRTCSGPDYDPDSKARRLEDRGCFVNPQLFCQFFSRRCEAQCSVDWAALPLLRSAAHNWLAEHTMATTVRFQGKTDLVATHRTEAQIQAMKNLYHHLWSGHYGKGFAKVRINGDTTKLHLANGLPPLEKLD